MFTDEGLTPEFEPPDGPDSCRDGQTAAHSESLKQFKTAEIADAVLGTELPANSAGIQALIPKSLISTPCEKEVEEELVKEEQERKQESPVGTDELNSTETTKTYKVSCDKRSIAGIDAFTVQVLNTSQVMNNLIGFGFKTHHSSR